MPRSLPLTWTTSSVVEAELALYPGSEPRLALFTGERSVIDSTGRLPATGVESALDQVATWIAGNPFADRFPISLAGVVPVVDEIKAGDEVTLVADRRDATILVSVRGEHLSERHYALRRGAMLIDLLDRIEVNDRSEIAGVQLFFMAFNVMEAILPSLISKESPAGYKGTAMGVYSTSQFIGVAIGGSLGGWLYGLQGAGLVFIAGAVLAAVWFLVSSTMKEPPYVSSLRITLSELAVKDSALESRLKAQPGVAEAIVVPEERSAYVKVDTKQTNRGQLEALVNSL